MVATSDQHTALTDRSAAMVETQDNLSDRVAVLLMGYGEVESYDDFANYNEQALNLLTAKFAPVPLPIAIFRRKSALFCSIMAVPTKRRVLPLGLMKAKCSTNGYGNVSSIAIP